MPKSSKPLPPLLVLLAGILIVSTASVTIRFAQREAASIVIAAYRLSIATLILLPMALARRGLELRGIPRRQWGWIALSGMFLAVHFASWIASLETATVATSAVLVSTTPLWVALASPLVLRERPGRVVLVGMAVALLGAVLVALSETCRIEGGRWLCSAVDGSGGSAYLGAGLALVGALAGAAYLLIGRWLRPTLSLLSYITTVYGTATLVLVALALGSGAALGGFSAGVWLAFAALAVGPQLLGHTSFNYALRFLPAAFVAVALLGEPVGSTVLAALLLREVPSALELIGGVVILAGIVIASWPTKPAQNQTAAASPE